MVKKRYTSKPLLLIIGILFIILVAWGVNQVIELHKAHSTFDNYYSFRGCTQLLTKTPTYGVCRTASGATIKIVLYNGKWYLNGDLPNGFWGHLN